MRTADWISRFSQLRAQGNMSDKTKQIREAKRSSEVAEPHGLSVDVAEESSKDASRKIVSWLKSALSFVYRVLGDLTAAVFGVAFAWLCAVNMLIAQRVTDVSFFKADASRWFTEAFEGKSADVGDVTLMWEAADNTVVFRAKDISVKTKSGAPLNALTYVETELALRDIVQGRLDPIRVEVDGGELSFLRDAEGNFIAGLGTPDTVGQFGPVWRGEKNDGDNDLEIGRIKSLNIENAKIYVQDAGADYAAELNGANFDVSFVPDGVVFDMKAELSVEGEAETTAMSLRGRVSSDLQDVDGTFKADNLNPSKMLPKLDAFQPVLGLNAPLNLSVDSLANRGSGLVALNVNLNVGEGTLTRGDQQTPFDFASIQGGYNPSEKNLKLKDFVLKSDWVSADGDVTVSNLGSLSDGLLLEDTRFNLAFNKLDYSGKAIGIQPFRMSNVRIEGQFIRDTDLINFDTFSADFGTFQPRLQGFLQRDTNGKPIKAAVKGRIDGTVSHEQLLSLWPETLIQGARNWVKNSIIKAELSNLNVQFDADEAVLSGQPLKNDDLTVTFDLAGGEVKYISTMTPLTNVTGNGTLLGNQIDFSVNQGQVDDVLLTRGKVTIPRIYPYGGDLIMEGQGQGPVGTLVGLLDQKPFEYVTPYGVSPSDFAGFGNIKLRVTRPLRQNITFEQVDFEISGQLTDVSAPFSVGKNALTEGAVNLLANREGLSVKGPVNIGPWQTNLSWREVFDNGVTPSRYKVEGRLNQSDLDSFGIGLREFIGGDVSLSIDAQADGLSITGAQLFADLKDIDMRIGPYWSKSKGVEGFMTGKLSFTKDQQLSLQNIKIKSPGLDLEGALDIGADYKLEKLEFTRAKIAGFIDASAQIRPSANQARFDVSVAGDYLDVSPFVRGSLSGTAGGIDVPLRLTSSVKRFALNEGYVLKESEFLFSHDGAGITQASLTGIKGEGIFNVELKTDKDLRTLEVDIPSASDAAFALFDIQSFQGGRLILSADLPAVGAEGPLTGTAQIDNLVILDAPIMTTMLSLASLQGLVDALDGNGLKFNSLKAPFSYTDGRLSVREARAAGAGLGMTANGEIDFDLKALDLDGVLVPAYTANSLLGSIPLIGDIFVGKKGEGIFALNYTVQGPFSQAQVAVNPLSALTPGFLRGIFATQREELPEQLKDQIESVRPSAPQPKDAP